MLSVRGYAELVFLSALSHIYYLDLSTCFFVLGLISTTPHGAEILGDYGWEVGLNPLGIPTGICVPGDIEKFVSVSHLESKFFYLLSTEP